MQIKNICKFIKVNSLESRSKSKWKIKLYLLPTSIKEQLPRIAGKRHRSCIAHI